MFESDVPKHLYKFRAIDSAEQLIALRSMLLKDEIWLASPISFNDPFDCWPVHSIEGSPDEIRAYYQRLIGEQMLGASAEERQTALEAFLALPPDQHDQILDRIARSNLDEVAICSFAAVLDEVLLWSHYANAHTGVALKFSGRVSVSERAIAFPVSYDEDRPVINIAESKRDNVELLKRSMLTKSKRWSYEMEHRLISMSRQGVHQFPADMLEGIALGYRISDAKREMIIGWVRERGLPFEVLQAKPDRRHFKMQFEPVDLA